MHLSERTIKFCSKFEMFGKTNFTISKFFNKAETIVHMIELKVSFLDNLFLILLNQFSKFLCEQLLFGLSVNKKISSGGKLMLI